MRTLLITKIEKDDNKKRLIRHRLTNIALTKIIMDTEQTAFKGTITYLFDTPEKGGFITLQHDTQLTIWFDIKLLEDKKEDIHTGTSVTVHFALTRNHDPMKKIQVSSIELIQ